MLPKKVTKSRTGSKGFLSKVISLNQNFKPKFNVVFFLQTNFLALIILQPETIKLNVTKSYILGDVVDVLALV